MEEETWSRRGLGGGGGVHFKIVIAKGGTIFICIFLLGVGGAGYVLIHHTFLKPPSPTPWDVINDRSLIKEVP